MNAMTLCDPLEPRRLLSAKVVDGVLHIRGSAADDDISVKQGAARLVVIENGKQSIFALSSVQRIEVNARAGDDRVKLATRLRGIVDGRDGNDTLLGGAGRDSFKGGDDDDVLKGGAGDDTLAGHAGHDTLAGNDGRDKLHGGDGQDLLDAGPGDDFIDAADQEVDTVHGGAGHDRARLRGFITVDVDSDCDVDETTHNDHADGLEDARYLFMPAPSPPSCTEPPDPSSPFDDDDDYDDDDDDGGSSTPTSPDTNPSTPGNPTTQPEPTPEPEPPSDPPDNSYPDPLPDGPSWDDDDFDSLP